MNTISPDARPSTYTACEYTSPKPAIVYCPCCGETRVPDKYHICTACQQYLADVDEMMAGE